MRRTGAPTGQTSGNETTIGEAGPRRRTLMISAEQALACGPQFARTGVKKGRLGIYDFGTYRPLNLQARADQRYPKVVPLTSQEPVIARYAAELVAAGALAETGDQLRPGGTSSFGLKELFRVTGSATVTSQRIIGGGAKGNCVRGTIDVRSDTQLLFSLDLSEVFAVALLRRRNRRGDLEESSIRLDIPSKYGSLMMRVVGQLDSRQSRITTGEVATTIVKAACALRRSGELDSEELTRVALVQAGNWAADNDNLIAYVRHPDDIPEGWMADEGL